METKVMLPLVYAGGFVVFAVMEWYRYLTKAQITPWTYTVVAIACIAFAIWRAVRLRPIVLQMRQGIEGERHVGQMLESLRREDYQIFHDVPGKGTGGGFNIDHLLIGPGGVFVVETKTISMPGRRRAVVNYDGECVLVDGNEPDRDPIAQVSALAGYVQQLFQDKTGRGVQVRPVVLYPGWWVNAPGPRARVWVLNPKQLPSILSREPRRLRDEDIALYADAVRIAAAQR